MPKATRNSQKDKFLLNQGSAVSMTAMMLFPMMIFLSHSGDGRMRLTRFMSLSCRILDLRRADTFAACGMYGLPSGGAGMADARECCAA